MEVPRGDCFHDSVNIGSQKRADMVPVGTSDDICKIIRHIRAQYHTRWSWREVVDVGLTGSIQWMLDNVRLGVGGDRSIYRG